MAPAKLVVALVTKVSTASKVSIFRTFYLDNMLAAGYIAGYAGDFKVQF